MKTLPTIILLTIASLSFGQKPKFDYPDTLWVYGISEDPTYGITPENPIKVGGGVFPKHVFRYLSSLTNTDGTNVSFEFIGECCNEITNREEPYTSYAIRVSEGKKTTLYFDSYEWEEPKIIAGYNWNETRKGYYGELNSDSISEGKGVYFYPNGTYYKGMWKSGKYQGKGTLTYADGKKFVGLWVSGKRNGFGREYYAPNSSIKYIEGYFENDKPKGDFFIMNSDGTKSKKEYK